MLIDFNVLNIGKIFALHSYSIYNLFLTEKGQLTFHVEVLSRPKIP